MKAHGMAVPANKVLIRVPDSREILRNAMKYFLSLGQKEMQWLPAYDKVGEWLADNEGRGLFLYGGVGLGKTVLARVVIPAILLKYSRKVVTIYGAQEMNDKLDEVLTKKIVCIDDVGTEDVKVDFGNKRLSLFEVLDSAEKQGKLVIMTSNFTPNELTAKYGERVIDRIKAVTKRIVFDGKSFR